MREPAENTRFDPYLWRKKRRDRIVQNENMRKTVLDKTNAALNDLSKRYAWEEVYLFGSIIKPGSFGPHSDVDLVVKGLDKFKLYAFISDLLSLVERDVDVVRLEECPFFETVMKRGVKWNPGKK